MTRSTDAQKAERLNAAHRLLERGTSSCPTRRHPITEPSVPITWRHPIIVTPRISPYRGQPETFHRRNPDIRGLRLAPVAPSAIPHHLPWGATPSRAFCTVPLRTVSSGNVIRSEQLDDCEPRLRFRATGFQMHCWSSCVCEARGRISRALSWAARQCPIRSLVIERHPLQRTLS
jgi:hypothetical protein